MSSPRIDVLRRAAEAPDAFRRGWEQIEADAELGKRLAREPRRRDAAAGSYQRCWVAWDMSRKSVPGSASGR